MTLLPKAAQKYVADFFHEISHERDEQALALIGYLYGAAFAVSIPLIYVPLPHDRPILIGTLVFLPQLILLVIALASVLMFKRRTGQRIRFLEYVGFILLAALFNLDIVLLMNCLGHVKP